MRYAPLRRLAIICMIPILGGCFGKDLPVKTSNFCDIYSPVYVHEDDTERTKNQVDENNASYVALCDEKKEE